MSTKRIIGALITCFFSLNACAFNWIQGSYTGDGLNNHAINGLGFQPDVIIIKGSAATPAFIRTSTMALNNSKQMDVAGAFSTTAIKSFTASGFTLGTSTSVNASGATYYFVAFDAGADLVTGTYPGDGNISKSVTGLGFSPDLVIILSDNATSSASPSYLSSAMPDDRANRFGNSGLWGFSIASLDPTGFTVGSNNNASGETYYYTAFKSSSSTVLKSGSYTGSASNKTVTVTGMIPRFVMVVNESAVATSAVMKMAAMPATSSVGYNGVAASANDIIGFASGSFTVKGGSVNANNTSYTNYYTAFGGGGQLPIELQEFKVICKEGGGAVINWITATESNNDYFTIERTEDGRNFKPLGRIEGAGNSLQLKNYSFTDDTAFSQPVYYRLKQTDYDGKYKYFNMVTFEGCDLPDFKISFYPNPVRNEINYQFELERAAAIHIELVDLFGKSVYVKQLNAEKGNQSLTLDLTDLPKGMYILKIQNGIQQVAKKIVKD